MGETTRVMIVDDQEMFRGGLCALLKGQSDMTVVGEASDGCEAVEKALRLRPDVMLMDINMPRMNGIDATRQIIEHRPETRIIMITIYGDDEHIFEAIKSGASGYVLKDSRSAELLAAIRTVRAGEVMIEPYIASRVINEFRRLSRENKHANLNQLIAVEQRILDLAAKGRTNREIGADLSLAEQTVKNKLSVIYQKLRVNNRAEAIMRAVQEGLLDDKPEQSQEADE
jgi:two-component system NarL family response regulator